MEFYAIVAGVVGVVLLVAYRHDRRRKGRVGDVTERAHGGGVAQGQIQDFRPRKFDPPSGLGRGND